MTAAVAVMVIYANQPCRECTHPRKDHTGTRCLSRDCECHAFVDPRSPRHTLTGERCRVCDEDLYADELAYALPEGFDDMEFVTAARLLSDPANRPVHPGCVSAAEPIFTPHVSLWERLRRRLR